MPAAIPNRISTQLRLNKVLHEKVKIIASLENRNMNSQIEYFIQKGIAAYEEENGAVTLPDEE